MALSWIKPPIDTASIVITDTVDEQLQTLTLKLRLNICKQKIINKRKNYL